MQFFFENNQIEEISCCLNEFLEKNIYKPIIFLCIGTDKVIGDSFGPIVGHFLTNEKNINIYGNLINTVNATNIYEVYEEIKEKYKEPYIVVIDSALSEKELKNKIVIGTGGINPGSALNKKINKIGDMYINAIVCELGENNFEELKKVKLYDIFNLSNTIVTAIKNVKCLKEIKFVNNYIS
ncbi:MAG: spore protease YyaC [Clostridiales bacterium]|nr:spore protease YyaC [Clostridiales bacterium]